MKIIFAVSVKVMPFWPQSPSKQMKQNNSRHEEKTSNHGYLELGFRSRWWVYGRSLTPVMGIFNFKFGSKGKQRDTVILIG